MTEIKENDNDQKEIEESKDLLKLPIDLGEEKYLLKIFPSKDNISIIFKLEKEKIETYYYYSKLDLKDFKQINKKFISDNNIYYAYIRLKEIIQNCKCSLEKQRMKIIIKFKKKNTEFSTIFTVRKKIVAQNRLNSKLVEQIQENKSKIKILKRQIAKLDKILQNKNDLIDTINTNIVKINNVVNNINNNNVTNIENNDLDNIKTNNISKSIENNKINNNNNTSSKEDENEEDEDLIKKLYKINEKENELLKQNLSLIKEYQQNEQEQESKRYISNNRKKKNKNKFKKIKLMLQPEENPQSQLSQDDTLFCFENIDVYKNKKIYETLIIFNAITILIIMYLLCSIFSLKSNLTFEKIKDQDLMKKLAFLSLLDDPISEDDMDGMRENIVDFQLKHNNDDDNPNTNQKIKYNYGKKRKEISLLCEEREKRYYKKHIRRRIHHRIKDINFELKYNSKEAYKYRSLYSNFKDISEILILIKNKNGKKIGLFSNNIILNNQDMDNMDDSDYVGYVYNNDQIYEVELKEFFENNGKYIQNIYDYLKSENLRIKKKHNNTSAKLLGDVEMFEIYQVKYFKY